MRNSKNRVLSMLIVLAMVFSMLPLSVFAESGELEQAVNTETDKVGVEIEGGISGSGTETDPVLISSAEGLKAFRDKVNSGAYTDYVYAKLVNNVVLTGEEWTPIGNGTRSGSGYTGVAFKGSFDAQNYKVTGLTVTSATAYDSVGLFGVLDGATVKDVKLAEVSISVAKKNVGALAGLATGGSVVSGVTVNGSVEGADGVGGVCGRATVDATVTGSVNNATVTATAGTAGGIVGKAYYTAAGKEMTVSDCVNNGAISAPDSGSGIAGGIVGFSAANVIDSTNNGSVVAGANVGGIVGWQQMYGEVSGNVNNVDITSNARTTAGGIIGWINYQYATDGTSSEYGNYEVITVDGNVNKGTIVATETTLGTGGIVGGIYNSAVISNNENYAAAIKGGTFASGIVGNLQSNSANGFYDGRSININNNKTTTLSGSIEAVCTNEIAYNNDAQAIYNGNVVVDNTVVPDMSGTVINVTAENAQDTLDGKYGNINGKTINFTESIENVLVLARATKYEGSGTVYYNYDISIPGPEAEATPWSENISSVINAHSHYYRTLENVTFTADAGVVLAGFSVSSGHNHTGGYDYVRDVATGNGVTCYEYSSLSGISFEGLTVTGSVVFSDYIDGTSFSGITFDGCTFTGTTNSSRAAISMNADNKYFTDVTVVNCVINNCYQGVYVQGVNGLVVANNTITNTTHNAIAIQSSTANSTKGEVVVKENYIEGAGDRAIRINNVADSTVVISINNNIMVNSGDSDGQLIKAGDVAGATVDLENNYWAGKELSVVIGAGVTAPTSTGIVSGNFTVDPTPYCQAGVVVTPNPDGTWGAVVPKEVSVTSYEELVAALAAGKTAILANDITATGEINGTDAVIDLNGFTLTLTVGGNNFFGASCVKGGTISITGCVASGDCIIGIGDYSNSAVLDLEGVNIAGDGYSSAYAVLYVYNSSTLNITGGSIIVANDNASAGGVIKAHSAANGKINVTGTETDPVELQFTNAKIGILDGTVVMDYVDLDIVGGANAINQSALTVKNSTLTIKDADGRALTLSQGDIVIENSVLDFSGCSEGEIRFKKALTLSTDEKSTIVECDIWTDTSATGAKVNDSVVVGTEKVPDTVTVSEGVTVVKSAPNGTITTAFTDTAKIWGEAGANAYESFVIKLYSGELLLATATLNNIGGIINGNVYVTWNIPLNSAGNDEYWTVNWVNKVTATTQPTGVELYCDGVKVATNVSKLNAPDDIKPLYAAVADENGEFVGYYTGLAEAFAAVTDGYTVLLVNDIVLSECVDVASGTVAVLDLSGKKITVKESSGNHIYAINNCGVLTIKDSVGGGSITARGIYNGYNGVSISETVAGAKLIIESGSFYAQDDNGGAAIFNCAELVVKGGTFGGYCGINNRACGVATIENATVNTTGHYAIQNNGGQLTISYANVSADFGAVGNFSGTTTIVDGHFEVVGNVGGHALYVAEGTVTVDAGEFVAYNGNDASSYALITNGACSVTVNGGDFFAGIGGSVAIIEGGSVEINDGWFEGAVSNNNANGIVTVRGGEYQGTLGNNVTVLGGDFVKVPYAAEGYLVAKNNETGKYTVLENVYFTYLGTSLRNEDAAEGKSNIRFGYKFVEGTDFTALVWGWSFGFGNTNITMAGKHYTVDNVTNLVLTNIAEAQYDKVLNVQLYFEVEIDGVTYTVYDNVQSGSVNGCNA